MNHLSLALLRSQRRHLRPCLSASSPGKGVNCVTIRRLPGPSSTTSSSLSTTRRSFTSEDMTASVHKDILEKVASGELSCDDALQQLAATTTISSSQAPQPPPTASSNEQVLESYANLDHTLLGHDQSHATNQSQGQSHTSPFYDQANRPKLQDQATEIMSAPSVDKPHVPSVMTPMAQPLGGWHVTSMTGQPKRAISIHDQPRSTKKARQQQQQQSTTTTTTTTTQQQRNNNIATTATTS